MLKSYKLWKFAMLIDFAIGFFFVGPEPRKKRYCFREWITYLFFSQKLFMQSFSL